MDIDLVEVQLSKLVLRDRNERQYLHLRELDGRRRSFPILIGDNEAFEIQRKLFGHKTDRPLTHDLVGRVVSALGARVERVIVSALEDSTFHAILELVTGSGDVEQVDCRPSDAIAVAAQSHCQLFVSREVLDSVASESGPEDDPGN